MEIYSWTLTLRIFYCSICFIYQNNIHVIYMHAMLFNEAHLKKRLKKISSLSNLQHFRQRCLRCHKQQKLLAEHHFCLISTSRGTKHFMNIAV